MSSVSAGLSWMALRYFLTFDMTVNDGAKAQIHWPQLFMNKNIKMVMRNV